MIGKELRALLTPETDNLKVLLLVEDKLKPGMFAFAEACICDTGIATLGPGEDGTGGGETVFLVLPHGSGVPEEDIENGKDTIPELN